MARRGARREERTGVTFADVAEDWFERGKFECDWSASTQVDYRSVLDAHLLKAFGHRQIEAITSEGIKKWRDKFAQGADANGKISSAPAKRSTRSSCRCTRSSSTRSSTTA